MKKYTEVVAAGLPIFHTTDHGKTAMEMADSVEKTVAILKQRWGLGVPGGCQLRVLTDWHEFIDQTAPALYRGLVKLTMPLWRRRAERAFALAGGWMIPWRGRPVVGVKPPELLRPSESDLGRRLFVPVTDLLEKVRHLTCHELTHACTAHLRLPTWLNEGLAMRAVDHLVGRPTVLEETRTLAEVDPSVLRTRSYRRLAGRDHDALIRLYATGYWVTRNLDEESPDVLTAILQRRRPSREVLRSEELAFEQFRVQSAY